MVNPALVMVQLNPSNFNHLHCAALNFNQYEISQVAVQIWQLGDVAYGFVAVVVCRIYWCFDVSVRASAWSPKENVLFPVRSL